jgi:hypothetical protein
MGIRRRSEVLFWTGKLCILELFPFSQNGKAHFSLERVFFSASPFGWRRLLFLKYRIVHSAKLATALIVFGVWSTCFNACKVTTRFTLVNAHFVSWLFHSGTERLGVSFKTFEQLSGLWISILHRIWRVWKAKGTSDYNTRTKFLLHLNNDKTSD